MGTSGLEPPTKLLMSGFSPLFPSSLRTNFRNLTIALVGTSGLEPPTKLLMSGFSPLFPSSLRTNFRNLTIALVGTSGLEPPTSRLSGVCSNQLSYVPIVKI